MQKLATWSSRRLSTVPITVATSLTQKSYLRTVIVIQIFSWDSKTPKATLRSLNEFPSFVALHAENYSRREMEQFCRITRPR